MASQQVERGILSKVFTNSDYFTGDKRIVLQVTNAKQIASEGPKRYRLLLGDGVYQCHGLYRPEAETDSEHAKGNIIALKRYELEMMGQTGKHVIIIEDFETIEQNAPKIGEDKPENIDEYLKSHPEKDVLAKAIEQKPAEATIPPPQVTQAPSAFQPQRPQQPPTYGGNSKKPDNLCLIEQLSPYQNVWTLKGRVSYKGDLRTWTNARGSGKLFNVNFLDESGEIRATAFNDNAENFYQILQENKVYYISKARIQPANKKFSNLDTAYELQMDKDTVIKEAEDAGSVPALNYKFVKLNKIQDLESDSIIDIVGVIKEVNQPFQITSKAGKAYDRRDITVVDDSQFAISVGLWNKAALNFDIPEGSVVAIKGCKVSDFGGKTLSLTPSAIITQNPEVNEAYTIKGWYDAQGRNENFQSLKTEPGSSKKSNPATRKKISEVIALEPTISEKPDYHSVKATVSFIKSDNFSYAACSSEGCSKKVIDQGDGTWRCEKCDINHANPRYRYILTMSVVDETGNLWLTLFDDQAAGLLGISANELMALREEEPTSATAYFEKVQMKEFEFRIRGRIDSYNGTERVRYSAFAANKLDFGAEGAFLVEKFEGLGL